MILSAALALCSCAGKHIVPNVEICAEIPFVDGKEGACGTTITKKKRIIPSTEWEKQRAKMLMIHADQWSEIRKSWKEGCRLALLNKQQCNMQLDSIDSAIMALDKISRQIGGE